MQNIITYNDFPKSFRPKINVKEKYVYRLYDSFDPKTRQHNLKSAVVIPASDFVLLEDEHGADTYNIAAVVGHQEGGAPKLAEIVLWEAQLNMIHLDPKKAKDRSIIEFFELCNFNASNPNRDKDVAPKIERVGEEADVDKIRELKRRKMDLIDVMMNLSDDEIEELAAKYRVTGTTNVKRLALEELAENNVAEFESIVKDASISLGSELEAAENAKIITHNHKTNEWTFKGDTEPFFKYKGGSGVKKLAVLADHCVKTKAGANYLRLIREELENL